jgi:hypothetical protein
MSRYVGRRSVSRCFEKASLLAKVGSRQADRNAIRPFHVNVPEAELTELRRRIDATRWPERETVTDASQGVQLATIQELAGYWATDYDWRKVEAKLNALPQFITEIDGLDISASDASFAVIRAKPLSQWKGLASAQSAFGSMNTLFLARRGVEGPLHVIEGPNGIDNLLHMRVRIDRDKQGDRERLRVH